MHGWLVISTLLQDAAKDLDAFPWLTTAILLPITASLLIFFIPDPGDGKVVRWYALGVTLTTFLITVAAYLRGYDPDVAGLQLYQRVSWLPQVGLGWSVGADGLSMPLILLTSFITTLACLAAWPVTFKPKLFFFLLLAMDGGQIAVFAVQDMLLFFLVGATYDRIHTLQLDEMGGVGQKMRKMFALWTICSLASLALPGMSGFVSELMVFVGFATDDAYSLPFRIVIDGLAAVGVILTPIYLLSMLREIFFGKENPVLADTNMVDAEPREIYIISCLLVPIIGIGLYPRLVTDTYRATIEQLVAVDESKMKAAIAAPFPFRMAPQLN
ncbi:MAG: hypothetical protein EBV10_02715 [Synechococcaceae bacterium WB6_1A_059]|nr:hypothetical protein [Synechococcaceae bacterium WB6_1A_059]